MRLASSLLLAAFFTSCKGPGDTDCEPGVFFADADGDGFGDSEAPRDACEAPDGFVDDGGDCDDADPATWPGAPEQCTEDVDRNCDGFPGMSDADADGSPACVDCDDADPAVHPDAPERCNDVDDDCDGHTDVDAVDAPLWYPDADADGHGADLDPKTQCEAPEGYVDSFDDCDDANEAVHPGAEESDCADPTDYNCDGSVGYDDRDDDGFAACQDCDDEQADVNADAAESCNEVDDDCDGSVDEAGAEGERAFYLDGDEDGYGGTDSVDACAAPGPEYVEEAGDCDDLDPAYHPGAAETCDDPNDYNCDGSVSYADLDEDGVPACEDCDDADAAVNPSGTEVCNRVDDDCDGEVDEDSASDAATWYLDRDLDTWGDPDTTAPGCDAPDGYVGATGDCDDLDPAYNPGAAEACDESVDYNCDGSVAYEDADADGFAACEDCADDDAAVSPDGLEACNAVDDDCDGSVDEASASDAGTWFLDADGDGYGDAASSVTSCARPSGYVADSSDCDDTSDGVHPSRVEVCNDADDDCDGSIDEDAADGLDFYADGDGDGWGAGPAVSACEAPDGFVPDDGDCDDVEAAVSPGADEVCDSVDDDCDGEIDEDAVDAPTWYGDGDGDTHGSAARTVVSCEAPSGYVAAGDDCDDAEADNFPGADERCDAIDNDCDGTADEDAVDARTWYADGDGDLYGSTSVVSCTAPSGYVSDGGDCDDATAAVHPGVAERCNGVDDDCDGTTDPSTAIGATTWYQDADADGYGDLSVPENACAAPSGFAASSADCDDTDGDVHPGATEVCDGVDDDCNGTIDPSSSADASEWYADGDADGFGDADASIMACDLPSGYTDDASDCDDGDADNHPGADEVCDSADNDCDSSIDEDATDAAAWHRDADSDGHGGSTVTFACSAPSGYVASSDDCDDVRSIVHPGATEVCNGLDDDCDGATDPSTSADASRFWSDGDADGYGEAATSVLACSVPAGFVANDDDCDDDTGAVHPGATEVCNGDDDDCDGTIDPSSSADAAEWYADTDDDGHGDADVPLTACDAPSGYVDVDDDCDDGDADSFPGADEVCDGADNDCNSAIDDAATDASAWYRDADADAYGSASVTFACAAPSGYVGNTLDCDDSRTAVNPAATEVCNGLDDDCDGSVDPGTSADASRWYADGDADGWGSTTASTKACSMPSGYLADHSDCNDAVPAIHPGATESCNGVDDDCDGSTDPSTSTDAGAWHRDVDGDGYGDPSVTITSCSAPSGYVADATDCDDGRAANHPGASERCDGVDNDCDAVTDEADATDAPTWHLDGDGDAYGDPSLTTRACSKPAGYVADLTDCDDGRAATHPGASETCNGIDDDCNGAVDPTTSTDALTWYRDADGDAYGRASSTTKACTVPSGYVADNTDCNDTTTAIHPDADELCDGLDNDCDGVRDEGAADASLWYADTDGDAHGDPATETSACAAPPGYIADGEDCDDGDASTYPGAEEVCDDADNDCNDAIDDGAIDASLWYQDADGDAYGDLEIVVEACDAPSGYVAGDTDCDDSLAAVHPGATEVCNGIDDNCDGSTDPATSADAARYYLDGDTDGYGRATSSVKACSVPSGYVTDQTDCDDGRSAVHPGATEVCNGLDDDCDGSTDPATSADAGAWYRDADGDAYGDASVSRDACTRPGGYVADATDCDDAASSAHPGGVEVCDDLDNDCDGSVDPAGSIGSDTFYKDSDGDSYGGTSTIDACAAPSGYVAIDGDCDDLAGTTHPFAPETCNAADDDCDDVVDEGVTTTYWKDRDADAHGDPASSTAACTLPSGYAAAGDDCDDGAAGVHPGAPEVCNSADDDCDDVTDEGVTTTYYKDADADSYGGTSTTAACSAPSGYAAVGGDCDDGKAAVNPAATETCNGADDDCDVAIDEGVTTTYYPDGDGDSYGGTPAVAACSAPGRTYVTVGGDCDDATAAVSPGATEACNGIDDDCDLSTDEGVKTTFYKDADGDSYGTSSSTTSACEVPAGYASNKDDCDDSSIYVKPKGTELCDGQRNDCDDASWTVASESGKASLLSGSAWTDQTSSWNGTSTTPKTPLASAGTTYLCPGTWYVNATVSTSGVTLAGRSNGVSTPILDGGTKGVVLSVASGGSGATFKDLTITHGNGTNGGGISAAGSVSLDSCTVTSNAATSFGGGIYVTSGTLALSKSTISSNTASSNGGGVYVSGVTVNVVDTVVSSNTSGASGGGLYVAGSGKLNVTGASEIKSNSAATTGGGVSLQGGTHSLTGTTISGNKTTSASINTGQGGGLYVLGGATTTLSGVTISSNTCTARGGGIYQTNSSSNSVTVKDSSIISGNSCTTPTTGATAVAEGGGWTLNGGSGKLESSTMTGNSVTATGGIAMGGGFAFGSGAASTTVKFTCTSSKIVSNTASGTTSALTRGGGVGIVAPTGTTATFDAASCSMGTSSSGENSPSDVWVSNTGTAPVTYSSYGDGATFSCTQTGTTSGSCTPTTSP